MRMKLTEPDASFNDALHASQEDPILIYLLFQDIVNVSLANVQ